MKIQILNSMDIPTYGAIAVLSIGMRIAKARTAPPPIDAMADVMLHAGIPSNQYRDLDIADTAGSVQGLLVNHLALTGAIAPIAGGGNIIPAPPAPQVWGDWGPLEKILVHLTAIEDPALKVATIQLTGFAGGGVIAVSTRVFHFNI